MSSNTTELGEAPKQLKKRVIAGGVWTLLEHSASQIIRFGTNLIITRLLVPEYFGLMGIIQVVISGLEMTSDIGLRPALTQNPNGDRKEYLEGAWALQILRGFWLWLASCGAAVGLHFAQQAEWFTEGTVFADPMLVVVLPVTCLSVLIAGFSSPGLYLLERRLELPTSVKLQLISQIGSVLCIIGWAYVSPSVWSLVAGGIVAAVLRLILSHVYCGEAGMRPRWNKEVSKELFGFGKWVFLTSTLGFLSIHGDRLLLGGHLTSGQMGIFGIAYLMSLIPKEIVSKLCHKIVFPALCEVNRDRPEEISKQFYRIRRSLDLALLPFIGTIVVLGTRVIPMLYDFRYESAGEMFAILSISIGATVFLQPANSLLMALGQPKWAASSLSIRILWVFAGIPLAWSAFGLSGVLWVIALSFFPPLLIVWLALYRYQVLNWKWEAAALAILILSFFIGAAVDWMLWEEIGFLRWYSLV